jgi:hypothetical protein
MHHMTALLLLAQRLTVNCYTSLGTIAATLQPTNRSGQYMGATYLALQQQLLVLAGHEVVLMLPLRVC